MYGIMIERKEENLLTIEIMFECEVIVNVRSTIYKCYVRVNSIESIHQQIWSNVKRGSCLLHQNQKLTKNLT